MATHSSIFAGKMPWTEEPGRLQSVGSQRVGHTHTCLKLAYLRLGWSWKTHFLGWQADVCSGLQATVPYHVETYKGPLEHPYERQLISPRDSGLRESEAEVETSFKT